jgi:hypothetical protein
LTGGQEVAGSNPASPTTKVQVTSLTTLVRRSAVGSMFPNGLAFDGTRIWVADLHGDRMSTIDVTTNRDDKRPHERQDIHVQGRSEKCTRHPPDCSLGDRRCRCADRTHRRDRDRRTRASDTGLDGTGIEQRIGDQRLRRHPVPRRCRLDSAHLQLPADHRDHHGTHQRKVLHLQSGGEEQSRNRATVSSIERSFTDLTSQLCRRWRRSVTAGCSLWPSAHRSR